MASSPASSLSRSLLRSLAALLAVLPFNACGQVLVGDGRIETEVRELPAFNSISLSGSGELRVHRGRQKVTVSVDSNILPYVRTAVSGGTLEIGLKPTVGVLKMSKLIVEVTMPGLEGLSVSGSGDAFVDRFEGDSFEGAISGSGKLKADLSYRAVAFTISGSGRIDLEGRTADAKLRVSGSGDIRAKDFAAEEAEVSISGSGGIEIRASRRLDVRVSGAGDLRYYGSPKIEQRISGSGKLRRIGD